MKYIPYGRQSIEINDIQEVIKVLKSDWITQGPKVQEFENALANYCGAKYAVAVSSGTAALHLACLASGLKKGEEAITSPITFLATPNSVLYTGAKPIFADIDYDTINIDPEQIKRKITKKTKAILPVHFAGLPCDMEKIYAIAKKNKLMVIEDACHALGAKYKFNGSWVKVGSCKHSEMAVFSFHPVKHITTGEGGAITTNNKKLYKKLKVLRNHGVYKDRNITKKGLWYYEMRDLGFNYRITDFQCALGISQMRKINKFINKRRKIAKIYNKFFKNNPYFDIPVKNNNFFFVYHLYPIRLKDRFKDKRQQIFSMMREKGLRVQVHYIPIYWQPYYLRLGYIREACPKAEEFYQREISIPLYPDMDRTDIKYVIDIIMQIFKKV